MKKKNFFFKSLLLILLVPVLLLAQQDISRYYLDLNNVEHGRLTVEFQTPQITESEVLLKFPKIIPGSYRIYDFGRFIHNVKAYTVNDVELKVDKTGTNTWKISNAPELYKISYQVEKTFGAKPLFGSPVFEPAGTNIDKDKNYLLNNHGFFGYIYGMTEIPIEVHITKPAGFFGASTLIPEDHGFKDVFRTENYFKLIDSPIMYSKPDTVFYKIGDTEILIAVYSETGKMKAKDINESIEEVILAIQKFFNGVLPVDRYAFLFYFANPSSDIQALGALEHMNSSVYFLTDMSRDKKN